MSFKEFFYFNKSDRKALLFLLVLGIGATALYFGLSEIDQPITEEETMVSPLSRSVRPTYLSRKASSQNAPLMEAPQPQLSYFDPNTADSTQLLQLGLRRWQVRNIYKYRAAGGVYKKPSDFARLYGLTVQQFKALEPYIRIAGDYRPASVLYDEVAEVHTSERDTLRYPIKLKAHERVSLNTADTTLLKKVPGIGSYFARQIVNYRNRLGGFYDAKQLLEIEDFPQQALSYFVLSPTSVQNIIPIHVNRMTLHQLRKHPYITYSMAKSITDYRRLKGPIKSLEDLSLLDTFSPAVIDRLKPYVVFD